MKEVMLVELLIDGVHRSFAPIRPFRAEHGLPTEFGIALFEPKEYAGLGSIDCADAGAVLNKLRAAVLAAIPPKTALVDLVAIAEMLTGVFRAQMYAINGVVNLKSVEIEFAAAGFADVTQNYVYALLRARLSGADAPPFMAIYGAWLESSTRLATTRHKYAHGGDIWRVQVVSHGYGRAGLQVERGDVVHYLADGALACPAHGFMAGLLREVCEGMATSPA
jgi:hypothetical protein